MPFFFASPKVDPGVVAPDWYRRPDGRAGLFTYAESDRDSGNGPLKPAPNRRSRSLQPVRLWIEVRGALAPAAEVPFWPGKASQNWWERALVHERVNRPPARRESEGPTISPSNHHGPMKYRRRCLGAAKTEDLKFSRHRLAAVQGLFCVVVQLSSVTFACAAPTGIVVRSRPVLKPRRRCSFWPNFGGGNQSRARFSLP